VLVDERRPQLARIDRARDGLHGRHRTYPIQVPRSWVYSLAILIVALIASMVIATVKLL
jgi:hypothetical protein